jgi:hypothetical protein
MRLRRIEPSKTATSATTATAAATHYRHLAATSGSTSPRAAKSAAAHHAAQHSHNDIRHIARSSTLPLRLCDCILNSLPNVVLAITRQPIRLPHRTVHCD